MKDRKKSIVKVFAGVIAIVLIAGILFVTNAFVGNPISAMLANRAIEKYIDQNYSHLDLEVEKAIYNFKDGAYMGRAKSRTSIDTKFAIYYRSGKVQRDDYEGYVLSKFNTIQRLSDEYSFIARDIIAKELGYKNNTTMVMFNKDEYANYSNNDILELDMKFDKALPMDSEVLIRLDLEDNSLESMAKVLTDAHKAFVDNNCNFNKYGLYSEANGTYVSVHEVTPADIESGNLLSLIKEAQKNEGANGISVFIKE